MTASGKDKLRKHRHEGDDVDHGAHSTDGITKAIQFVLGAAVIGSAALVLYTMVLIAR